MLSRIFNITILEIVQYRLITAEKLDIKHVSSSLDKYEVKYQIKRIYIFKTWTNQIGFMLACINLNHKDQQFLSLLQFPTMHQKPSSLLAKRNIRYSSLTKATPHSLENSYRQVPSQSEHQKQPSKLQQSRLNRHLTSLTRAEISLEKQISDINLSLHRMQKRLQSKNGLMFQSQVDYHLANTLRELMERRIEVIDWGLKFENQPQLRQNEIYKKGRMLPAIDFSGKLKPLQRSHAKDENKYTFQRYREAASLFIDKWQYFSKGVTPKYYQQRERIKTEQDKSNKSIMLSNELSRSLHFDPSLPNIKNGSILASKSLVDRVNHSQLSPTKSINVTKVAKYKSIIPSPPQIFDILSKENKLISIWLPPSTNPELLGVMTLLVRQKQDGTLMCLIRKYCWVKKALSRRFFNCILDWLFSQNGLAEQLTLLTNKPLFDEIFAPLGWKLINWMRDDKLRIAYRRTLF